MSPRFQAGFAREIITPQLGVPLAGYFSPRPNRGVADELFVRAAVFRQGGALSGVVTFDLCCVDAGWLREIRKRLTGHGIDAGTFLFHATHTHTAPYPRNFFGDPADPAYLGTLVEAAVRAVRRAHANLAPAEIAAGKAASNRLAFNRRYRMKDGRVITNPGKGSPDAVEPEGPVDRDILVAAFRQEGHLAGLLVNLVNHTDTTGGDRVSADWPGHLERTVQDIVGEGVQVHTLIGASGNVNHVDPDNPEPQTGCDEARRIGIEYGRLAAKIAGDAETLPAEGFHAVTARFDYRLHRPTPEEISRAKAVIAAEGATSGAAMTSEDLASGAAEAFFARQLLLWAGREGADGTAELTALKFAPGLAIVSLPGEPFTEIGMRVKAASPYPFTLVASLAQDHPGYICLGESYARGGYEILPTADGRVAAETAEKLTQAAIRLLQPKRS